MIRKRNNLRTEALGRGTVTALNRRTTVDLLGVDSAADAICHLDVQLGENIRCSLAYAREAQQTIIDTSFRQVTNSRLLNNVLDEKTLDSLVLEMRKRDKLKITFGTQRAQLVQRL